MAVTAVLLLSREDQEACATVLGHRSVLAWALNEFQHVRGVDRTVCLASPTKYGRTLSAQRELTPLLRDIEIQTWPEGMLDLPDQALYALLLEHLGVKPSPGAVFLVSRLTMPFLPSGRIQAVLRYAQTATKATTVITSLTPGKPLQVIDWQGKNDAKIVTGAAVEMFGCRAYDVAAIRHLSRCAELYSPRVLPVEVSPIEALDMADRDQAQMAQALVRGGER